MSCLENVEVYIPKEACVKNLPVQSLPTSTAKKIGVQLFQNGSEELGKPVPQTVTWISPVELREKEQASGKDCREMVLMGQKPLMTKITPGQFWLPVVSSNITAFRVLRKILRAHKTPIQLSEPETEATSVLHGGKILDQHAFIIFNSQIFLCVRKLKSRIRQVSSQHCALATPRAFPVSPSQQLQQNPTADNQSYQEPPPRTEQRTTEDVQTPARELGINLEATGFLSKISEERPEQSCADKECQKAAGTITHTWAQSSPPRLPEDDVVKSEQKSSCLPMSGSQHNILHRSPSSHRCVGVSQQPEGRGAPGNDKESLDTAVLPWAEGCLAFDFDQLAQEEKINNLRARLRKQEAALNIFNLKPSDQI